MCATAKESPSVPVAEASFSIPSLVSIAPHTHTLRKELRGKVGAKRRAALNGSFGVDVLCFSTVYPLVFLEISGCK